MERKIGEIFEYNGEWYQCVENTHGIVDACEGCSFYTIEGLCSQSANDGILGHCGHIHRVDDKNVIFKKLEKWGKTYPNADKLYQLYILPMNIEKLPTHTEGINLVRFDIVEIEIKQTKEDMEDLDKIKVSDYTKVEELNVMEEKKLNLKPFDIQKAREGKPVCTRDGRKARIICFDSNDGRPIVALVTECDDEEEIPYKYHCDGSYNCQSIPSDNDLMMLHEKKEGWINVYKVGDSTYVTDENIYETKEEAIYAGKENTTYVASSVTEWEE